MCEFRIKPIDPGLQKLVQLRKQIYGELAVLSHGQHRLTEIRQPLVVAELSYSGAITRLAAPEEAGACEISQTGSSARTG